MSTVNSNSLLYIIKFLEKFPLLLTFFVIVCAHFFLEMRETSHNNVRRTSSAP